MSLFFEYLYTFPILRKADNIFFLAYIYLIPEVLVVTRPFRNRTEHGSLSLYINAFYGKIL